MKVHYLEIVCSDVGSICKTYEDSHGVSFTAPDDSLGGARTCILLDGSVIGVRAPMSESEKPVVRPYWLVDDIEKSLALATKLGAEVAHPPLQIPGKGRFAIYIQGGIQHGLWQL